MCGSLKMYITVLDLILLLVCINSSATIISTIINNLNSFIIFIYLSPQSDKYFYPLKRCSKVNINIILKCQNHYQIFEKSFRENIYYIVRV